MSHESWHTTITHDQACSANIGMGHSPSERHAINNVKHFGPVVQGRIPVRLCIDIHIIVTYTYDQSYNTT